VEKSPASPRFAFITLLAALRPCADKLADNAAAILFAFAYAYARLISHVTRLSAVGRNTLPAKEKRKARENGGQKKGQGRREEGKQKGSEKPLTLADGVLPQSGHVPQPCAALSLSFSRAFLLLLFAPTNLRNGRFVAAASRSRPARDSARMAAS